MVSFVCIYLLLLTFLSLYAKKVEKPLGNDVVQQVFKKDENMTRGLKCFGGLMCGGILIVLSSVVFPVLQDFTMIIVALTFLVAGIISTRMSGRGGNISKTFLNGVMSVLPGVIMILMANSIKYTLEEGNILNTILQGMLAIAQTLPGWAIVLFIYLIVLVMNFFISSGSAKAFLLMPLIVPLAEPFGISAQLCVMAFAFGDGFSNVLYPTNPALLISLGLADVSYGKWFKWSVKFQILNLVLTSSLLLLGLAVGY